MNIELHLTSLHLLLASLLTVLPGGLPDFALQDTQTAPDSMTTTDEPSANDEEIDDIDDLELLERTQRAGEELIQDALGRGGRVGGDTAGGL